MKKSFLLNLYEKLHNSRLSTGLWRLDVDSLNDVNRSITKEIPEYLIIIHFLSIETADAIRVKRQSADADKKEESFEQELCKDKDAGEWFRLVAGEGDNCRDVIQCTSSVRVGGLQFKFKDKCNLG